MFTILNYASTRSHEIWKGAEIASFLITAAGTAVIFSFILKIIAVTIYGNSNKKTCPFKRLLEKASLAMFVLAITAIADIAMEYVGEWILLQKH